MTTVAVQVLKWPLSPGGTSSNHRLWLSHTWAGWLHCCSKRTRLHMSHTGELMRGGGLNDPCISHCKWWPPLWFPQGTRVFWSGNLHRAGTAYPCPFSPESYFSKGHEAWETIREAVFHEEPGIYFFVLQSTVPAARTQDRRQPCFVEWVKA